MGVIFTYMVDFCICSHKINILLTDEELTDEEDEPQPLFEPGALSMKMDWFNNYSFNCVLRRTC